MNTTPDIESTFKNDLATETRTIPNNTASETQATVGLHPKQSFNASNDDILEILSKVLVVGEVGVGKTRLELSNSI
jgi:Tat protein secretion system quality control protein TatD with DNase activity